MPHSNPGAAQGHSGVEGGDCRSAGSVALSSPFTTPTSRFLTCYYGGEDKRGHGGNNTSSVATVTWICKALQSSARSPQERCCLTKRFAWPFLFHQQICGSAPG